MDEEKKKQIQEENFVPSTKVYEGSEDIKKKYVFNNPADKIQEAERLKQEGNQFFKNKQYKDALRSYNKAILFVGGFVSKEDDMYQYGNESTRIEDQQQIQQIQNLQSTTYSNMAQIDLINKNYEKAIDRATKSLKYQVSSKALYRRGCAYLELSDLTAAGKDFLKVQELDPTTQIQDKLQILKKKEKEQDKQLQSKLKKMFI